MIKKHDIIELEIFPLKETEKAVMVKNLKGKDVWLPKSQIEVDDDGIQLPEWLALDNGLI